MVFFDLLRCNGKVFVKLVVGTFQRLGNSTTIYKNWLQAPDLNIRELRLLFVNLKYVEAWLRTYANGD